MLTCKLARSVANAPNAIASTSVKLVVSYRCTNNCGAFRCVVSFGLGGVISREAHSIDIHRSIRFLLVLLLNVEMQMSYQLSTRSAGPAAARNDEGFYSLFQTGGVVAA